MVSAKTSLKFRKAHRYLGLFLGIQFLFWTISGLYFSWTNLDEIHGDQFKKNNYGMSNEIFQKMNFTINESPTYTDLIIFLSRFLEKVSINYLEIGVSVLKNYIQIINSLRNANIIAYDINPVNPNFDYLYNKEEKKMKMGTFEDNQIYYFEGSVTEENDFKLFKDHINKKFNIIFSDLSTNNACYFVAVIKFNFKKRTG